MEDREIRKQITVSVLLFFIVSVIMVMIGGVINYSIKGTQVRETQRYMKEIVSQYKNIITAEIDGDIRALDTAAAFVEQGDIADLDAACFYLEEVSGRNDFLRMGFISPSHKGYFIDADGNRHDGIDVSDEDFVKSVLSGEHVVSEVMGDKLSSDSVVVYGVPVIRDGKVTGAVTATRTASSLLKIISQEIFDGVAYIHIVDHDGNFILRSDHAVIKERLDNVFDKGDIPDETRRSIRADMEIGRETFTRFEYDGVTYSVTFIPVGINDWQIFCLVPQSFLNHNFDIMFIVFLCVMTCIVLLFCALFLYIYKLLKNERKTLEVFAYKDILTGADNRNCFDAALPELLCAPADYAFILMNISGFKFINEFFGFERGNGLLRHVAQVLRESIGDGELCYRDTADRFGLLVYYHNKEELVDRIREIRKRISNYTVSPNQDYHVNCSFGINIIQGDVKKRSLLSPDAAINGALLALNSINGNTENPLAFYNEEIHEKARKKVEIASRMHAALANQEFRMYLQPKYHLEDNSLHSVEALVRWRSKEGVIYYPDEFIPVFEENGFITELDMYMLEEACKRVSSWIQKGYKATPISVNQSRIFFYDEAYLDKFHKIVGQYDIDPSLIILEVTESVAMSNLSQVKTVIGKLRKLGFAISMDDFGSGYSSLNTLEHLDITELKLDKEFLSEQSTSPRGRVVIESMIYLARALSITTVAEGIENEEQLEFLKSIHCDIGQGYYFAKPMPAEEFEQTILK